MIKSKCTSQFHWLGLQKYTVLDDQQKKLVPEILGRPVAIVFGAEFFPVLTLGVRAKSVEDLFFSDSELTHLGLEVVKTDRGGQATIHSPGQLVIYPMLDLKVFDLGIRDFVCRLMKITIKTLRELGIEASYFSEDPGIYTAHGKIGFCGLKSDHGVMRHGLAINIKNDLSLFQGIRSCGHTQPRLDQVSRYHPIETAQFFQKWTYHFENDFYLSVPNSIGMDS